MTPPDHSLSDAAHKGMAVLGLDPNKADLELCNKALESLFVEAELPKLKKSAESHDAQWNRAFMNHFEPIEYVGFQGHKMYRLSAVDNRSMPPLLIAAVRHMRDVEGTVDKTDMLLFTDLPAFASALNAMAKERGPEAVAKLTALQAAHVPEQTRTVGA